MNTRRREERTKVYRGERVMGEGQEERMGKQRRGAPDNQWRLVFPHGKLVAKSGPVASVLSKSVGVFVCVSGIWLHPS